jgi:hypothetical protein
MLDELAAHAAAEDGGKYVGYVLSPSDHRLHGLAIEAGKPAIVVTDFLPSGPNAIRTAVELVPDGEYQEAMYRQLEQLDPAIEHLGTWHSHHCNGLATLSPGDIRGYRRTVNRKEYRLDFFLASLVKYIPRSASDAGWIDHFLFVRGDDDYYCINDSIQMIDWPTNFGAHTGHGHAGATGVATGPKFGDAPIVTDEDHIAWYGRQVLSEDRRTFKDLFGDAVSATKRGTAITLTGQRGRASIAITYPSTTEERTVTIAVQEDGAGVVEMVCDLEHRARALKAALVVMELG